jgi:integrase
MPVTVGDHEEWLAERAAWLDEDGAREGMPFLLRPDGRYDLELHRYFDDCVSLMPFNSARAAASDLKCFFDFLWFNRAPLNARTWRDATREDRSAYKKWRLFDPNGPGVGHSTWDREVASANAFYRWADEEGYVERNPIVQRVETYRDRHGRRSTREVPRETSNRGPRNDIAWFTPRMYRTWRDVGVLGRLPDGGDDRSFRGRWASRNGTFTDFMVRTGLRIAEQTSLSVFELPEYAPGLTNFRTRLPTKIAKGGSGRVVYVPGTTLADVWDYIELERADAVAYARSRGLYDRIPDRLVVEDRTRPVVHDRGRLRKVGDLGHEARRVLFVRTADGLEPAAIWLNQYGLPGRVAGWESMFDGANARCARVGVGLRAHPHLLRHSMAVITLEQLWRGHLEVLGAQNEAQRRTYQMIYGDPLRWVQMRLGHASMTSTLRYQHTLHELEMQTRMALIPDSFEDTASHPDDMSDFAKVAA